MEKQKEELFKLLYGKSFMYRENPPFKLVSGKESFYYYDCKATTLDSSGVALTGICVYRELEGLIREGKVDGIGGLTLGADPISVSTANEAFRRGHPVSPLIVRKEPKKHGTRKWIEGSMDNVKNVIVVDDVITTGGSTVIAVERMRESGLNIIAALVLIDREEGGRENIEKEGVKVISLFTRNDFDRKRLGA